ncbi:uncharacterized protein VICG_01209 [Vittaforma corneae ATCC 50505]|uniref:Uncharacterized protein n=1 Tax=Vittaforma corneae (strain ATCC 50505) TaxID=993615 RepID=L2GMJ1_VITCO|nr:uncharacterized protein VICG_01209 [Vittaforma corneae ATCC 50505]ELA41705.1 hypothetical protein VICG_01209 [Vittaforma corneae ATCC 50505]
MDIKEEKCRAKESEDQLNSVPDSTANSETLKQQGNSLENSNESKIDNDSFLNAEERTEESFHSENESVKKIKSNEECDINKQDTINTDRATCQSSGDIERGRKDRINNKSEESIKPYSSIFDREKTSCFSKNIFTEPGTSKVKKESTFLKMDLNKRIEEKKDNVKETGSDFIAKCKLAYFEDEEWTDVGWGEIHLKDGYFYFIRDFLKTVILKFCADKGHFKKEEACIVFKAKGKKSLGNSFEIVERKYKAEFENKKLIVEFLNKLP